MHNFKGFKGKGPSTSTRGGMRLSASTTAPRGASLPQSKHATVSGRGFATSRSLSAVASRQQQDHGRTDLFGRPILRLPTFNRLCEPLSALPTTVEVSAEDVVADAPPASTEASLPTISAPAAESKASSPPPSPRTPVAAQKAAVSPLVLDNTTPLSEERLQESVLARFLIPRTMGGFLIGEKGVRMDKYKTDSGAKVWLSGIDSIIKGPDMRMVCVSGKVDQVSKAVTLIFNDLTGEEVPNKRKAYFKSRDEKMIKARFLAPAWLSGTILGRDARHIRAVVSETGAMLRLSPAAGEEEQDRLVEIAGSEVSVVARAVEEILKLFLRNPKYKAVYIAPGVSAKSLKKRSNWYANTQKNLKAEGKAKWEAKQGGPQPAAVAEVVAAAV